MVLAATEDVLAALVGAAAAYGVWRVLRRRRGDASAHQELVRDEPAAVAAARDASAALLAEYGGWMYLDPSVLAVNETFEHGVATLAGVGVSPETLLGLAEEGDWMLTAIAFAAIARRDDLPERWADVAVQRLRASGSTTQHFILGALARRAPRPVIGSVLSQLDRLDRNWLATFLADRLAADEPLDAETLAKNVPIRFVPLVADFLEDEGADLPAAFREAFEGWQRSVVDVDFLREFADVWERPFEIAPAPLSRARAHLADLVLDALSGSPRQSVLLVGENGVGKTTLVRSTLERLPPGWIVFEASAAAVNAGAVYIGELEGRVQQLVGRLRGHEAVWVFPAFDEALYTGQHMRSPVGLLDLLLPHVESRALTIVAEITPSDYAQLVKARPRVPAAFRALRVRPLPAPESVAVAADALAASGARATEQVLREAFELAHQFLPGSAAPGNLVRLVEAAAEAVAERGEDELEVRDVLATLAGATGLPLALLDPTAPLDVDFVRAFLEERVLGQPEAVEALVERITLIKAGLTDPTRPLGVFLFVGPTGTGKTEIAKTLAEFLFGSPERIVRLDLTEFQTPESLERLLSDAQEGPSAGLIASVRRDPFSVVLLDEFEKAAPPIWDVFLQVFDDGRLTDTDGQTTDFTRCVIVLTSNVGSAIATHGGLGFAPDAEPFRRESVERAVSRSFRPEFLNRIDRVVVFHPFERSQMRALLDKELAQALRRPGLRTRPWAVELDASAVSFLIEQGFSPELGARPLKRAVERHLLTPLARAIVEKTAPEGEQFLFVSAPRGRGIEVAFVDPDAEPAAEEREEAAVADERLDVRAVALSRRADARTARFLLGELERIAAAAGGEAVDARKQEALASIARPGFWDDPERFTVLAEIEYLDRFEAALATAAKLGRRLDRQLARNGAGDRSELAALLANRLYVLGSALTGLAEGAPFDLFLRIRPAATPADGETARLVDDLAAMYAEWAANRGMRLEELDRGEDGADRTFAISGLGAGAILEPEAGLHVRELPRAADGGSARVERVTALVELAPMPPGTGAPLLAAAERALAQAPPPTRVVRRYRDEPNPLVRDAARGYRTGRLARVLAGDFDLF